MKQQLQKEQAHFKSCIEEIQLKLTSPTLEAKKLEGQVAEKGKVVLSRQVCVLQCRHVCIDSKSL